MRTRALAEKVSDIKLFHWSSDAIRSHEPPKLKQQGRALVETFAAEIEQLFERRVSGS